MKDGYLVINFEELVEQVRELSSQVKQQNIILSKLERVVRVAIEDSISDEALEVLEHGKDSD